MTQSAFHIARGKNTPSIIRHIVQSRTNVSVDRIKENRGFYDRRDSGERWGQNAFPRQTTRLRSSFARFFSTSSEDIKDPTASYFALPTFDKAFKEVLHDAEARNSLFRGFVDRKIQSSEILGLSNSSFKDKDQVVMDSLGAFFKKYKPLMDTYAASNPRRKSTKTPVLSFDTFTHELATLHYSRLCHVLPIAEKEGIMDFKCRLNDGSIVLVEMQVRPDVKWNKRALAYLANTYSSQLGRGMPWDNLKKVYALNILGGFEPSKLEAARHTWEKFAGTDPDGTSPVLKRY